MVSKDSNTPSLSGHAPPQQSDTAVAVNKEIKGSDGSQVGGSEDGVGIPDTFASDTVPGAVDESVADNISYCSVEADRGSSCNPSIGSLDPSAGNP